MKKSICLLLCLLLIATLSGCGGQKATDRLKIVATVLPEYDWIINLTKGCDKVDVTLISDKGVDMHSFQPSAEDVFNIASADLMVYTGGRSDKWVEDALKNPQNENMIKLNLIEELNKVGGGRYVHHSHKDDEDCHDPVDEHIWLSLKNAKLFCSEITNRLTYLDPEGKELYEENLKAYLKELEALDSSYEETVAKGKRDTLIFADRFPFIYLLEDYGIKHFAAFEGCSADSVADFDTVFGLAENIDRLDIDTLLITDNVGVDLAKSVIENTKAKNARILSLNSMQTTTLSEAQKGSSYIKIMSDNLEIIKKALESGR